MTTLDELERRIAALEEHAEVEAGLRASMDRDLGDIKASLNAQRHSINALRETQAEHSIKLDQLITRLDRIEKDHGVRLTHIVSLLDRLIEGDR